ncbi:MAG: hypothetical protein GY760_12520 [Deltaproteobacteria bacterium]|nr:hypothetical protein [Deltaproteobacteria bacterium]
MGRIIIINLMFVVLLAGVFATQYLAQISVILAISVLALLILVMMVFGGCISAYIKTINNFKPSELKCFFQNIKAIWKYSILGGLFYSIIFLMLGFGIKFYSVNGGIIGLVCVVILCWILISVLLSSLYYFPVMNRLGSTFPKMIKKCFLIFLDNPFHTVGIFFVVLINLLLSCTPLIIITGPGGAFLWLDDNLKLLIYKYDYMEENPDAGRKIPWRALFVEDNNKIGPRTFRNTIFPWK